MAKWRLGDIHIPTERKYPSDEEEFEEAFAHKSALGAFKEVLEIISTNSIVYPRGDYALVVFKNSKIFWKQPI
jgi:hypothetical protein